MVLTPLGRSGTLLLTVTAAVWLVATAVAATKEVEVRLGDKVTGTLAAEGDSVGLRFYAVAGAKVRLTVTPAKGSTLKAAVVLKDARGADVSLGKSLKQTAKSTKVVNFPIAAAGFFTFEVSGAEGTGGFVAATGAKFPKKVTLQGALPANSSLPFALEPGSTFKGTVTAAKGASLKPAITSITDRSGPLQLTGLTASGRTAKFKSATTAVGGPLTLTVGGTGTGDFTAKLIVKVPKSKQTVDAANRSRHQHGSGGGEGDG